MGRRRNVRSRQLQAAAERESLERRFLAEIQEEPRLAPLVVARGADREPYHRWLHYRQGFSPELVRRFVAETESAAPLLDPFNGSGTVTTECARLGIPSIGVEAVGPLSRIAMAPHHPRGSPWDPDGSDLTALFRQAPDPLSRAAVLCCAAEERNGEGQRRRLPGDDPAKLQLKRRLIAMEKDLESEPLKAPAMVIHGDARSLPLATESVGGILTSPPYLSRYDYTKINRSLYQVMGQSGRRRGRRQQVRASRGRGSVGDRAGHPAADEVAGLLAGRGDREGAAAVQSYFLDMTRCLEEMHRVLRPGGALWCVVAGAALKKEYVPSDLILTEIAESLGLRRKRLVMARHLGSSGGRRLGTLRHVSPRETLLCLQRVTPARDQ